MRHRWQLDPLVSSRRLGDKALTYHAGSGDTHLLNPFSEAVLRALADAGDGRSRSPAELLADERVAALAPSERELTDALCLLEEAGIVRALAVDE